MFHFCLRWRQLFFKHKADKTQFAVITAIYRSLLSGKIVYFSLFIIMLIIPSKSGRAYNFIFNPEISSSYSCCHGGFRFSSRFVLTLKFSSFLFLTYFFRLARGLVKIFFFFFLTEETATGRKAAFT